LVNFQNRLKKYKLTVYNYGQKGRNVHFEGNNTDAQYRINLLFHDGHYNVITSLTATFVCVHYCEACHVPYDHIEDHRCKNKCPACQTVSPPCSQENGGIHCPICNNTYKNQTCFSAHQKERCTSVRKCFDCDKIIVFKKRKSNHVCGEVFCVTCKDFMPTGHKCFMKVDTRPPKTKDSAYIFLIWKHDKMSPWLMTQTLGSTL
jgi:hypothetical protein